MLLILGRTCGDKAGGKAKMKDIEAEMYLSQSALSRTVTRLEKAGLVTRAACDFDRRANFLMLTPAGIERFEAAKPTHRAVLVKHLTRTRAPPNARRHAGSTMPCARGVHALGWTAFPDSAHGR